MPFTREVVLEQGGTGWHKIQSVFSWVRMWGGGVPLAYAVQGAVDRSRSPRRWPGCGAATRPIALKAAALPIAAILATPYSLDYDLVVLAPAIAFLAADGLARGFAPLRKIRAGAALVHAADRPHRRRADADPARRAGHARWCSLLMLRRAARRYSARFAQWHSAAQPIK